MTTKNTIDTAIAKPHRTNKPRLWKSLDRCVDYLKSELHIARFDMLDGTQHSDIPMAGSTHSNAADRMRNAHEAASHNRWFREQVAQGIAEADDPNTQWVTNDEAKASWAKKRAALVKLAKGSAA